MESAYLRRRRIEEGRGRQLEIGKLIRGVDCRTVTASEKP